MAQEKNANKKELSIRVDIDKVNQLMDHMAELVIARSQLVDGLKEQSKKDLNEDLSQLTRITTDLQNIMMKIRMLPLSTISDKFPRKVRDIARNSGKNVDFKLAGQDTELDRTVIEQLSEPIMSLLEYSVNMMETPEERKKKGKGENGLLMLKASNEGSHVRIEMFNDGKPMSRSDIANKAIRAGLIPDESRFNDEEINKLIFDAEYDESSPLFKVKETLEDVHGQIFYERTKNGSRFVLQLPLTLAIIQALLVQLKKNIFAVPIVNVESTLNIDRNEIQVVQSEEVIVIRGEIIPVIDLTEKFFAEKNPDDELHIVVVREGNKKAALIVDSLIGQEDIVIKSLGPLLKDIDDFTGGAILGDGSIALILDTMNFLNSV